MIKSVSSSVSPAVLHTAGIDQLPLRPLTVHGLEVLQRGAGVVLVELPGLQVTLVPLHISPAVSHNAVDLGTRWCRNFTTVSVVREVRGGGETVRVFHTVCHVQVRDEHWTYLATGTGSLGQAPLLTGGPVTLLILRSPSDVPLHERGGASLGLRVDLRVNLLYRGIVDDDDTVDNDNNHDDAHHQRQKHSKAQPFLPALGRKERFWHIYRRLMAGWSDHSELIVRIPAVPARRSQFITVLLLSC